ncbi:hypothetical protein ACFUOZ_20715, partial [Paenarthrobacter sp. NPDC057355]|uniref:hypothetical protein n=1 Tax=Paenarthrobacter sp. NPDC057355 TaxID=3346105 RepID=UPI00362A0134
MVLGLWSSTAGVGAGRVLAGRDGSGVLARLLGVILAVAVTLTLFVVVDVAAGPAANAKPPVVVPTTPPRVTDPNKVRRIGFPTLPGTNVPQFDAVEVYPGIWVANHNDPGGSWLQFGKKWGPAHDEVVWQRNVDQITADLDRLLSTGSGKSTMKVAGTLEPNGGKYNQWIDHSGRGLPAGTANPEIGVVIFPTPGQGAQATPLNEIPAGSASYVAYDPAEVTGFRDVNTATAFAQDPVAGLGHELIHAADYKAYTNPRGPDGKRLEMDTPYRIFRGGTREAPTGPSDWHKTPLAYAEILTVGGEAETTLLRRHLKAHPELSPVPLEDLSITSHPWRLKAAVQALDAVTGGEGKASPELLKRARLLSELAMVNPTEGKIGADLETSIRTRYLNAYFHGPDGRATSDLRFTRDPAAGPLSREDLANPYQSSKLRPMGPGRVPVCGAAGGDGANESCEPDVAESKPMSEEEVKTFEEDVKTRVELEKSSTSESVFFESLSVEDLQVLAGMGVTGSPEMVRDAVSFAPKAPAAGEGHGGFGEGPGGVGTPEFNEVLRSKGFAELNSRGEGPH